MGDLAGEFGFPNGPIPGLGGVEATGSAPAALRVPRHRFGGDFMALIRLQGITLAQLTTNFGIDAPLGAATLAKGGGPGSFTWCPQDAACIDRPGTMYPSDPPRGMGTRAGRVIYRAGANRFGGVMQMGLRRGGVDSSVFNLVPPQMRQILVIGVGSALRTLAPGGLGAAGLPRAAKRYLPAGFVTHPLKLMVGQLIQQPGPKLTTMKGLTNTMTGPVLTFHIGTTPMGFRFGQKFTSYGFAHTTGSVFAQQTRGTGGDDFFSFKGYDKRTALGADAIQTVAGGLSFQTANRANLYATMHRVRMSLAPPIPSLSPGGFAAAGALLLLAAGYGLKRRRV